MWKDLIWLNEKTGLIDNIPSQAEPETTLSHKEITRKGSQIKEAIHLLKHLSYREEKIKQSEKIKKALQQRCIDLKMNQRRVI